MSQEYQRLATFRDTVAQAARMNCTSDTELAVAVRDALNDLERGEEAETVRQGWAKGSSAIPWGAPEILHFKGDPDVAARQRALNIGKH